MEDSEYVNLCTTRITRFEYNIKNELNLLNEWNSGKKFLYERDELCTVECMKCVYYCKCKGKNEKKEWNA